MIKTQVQIPDELFRRAKEVASAKEWSFAEIVRRGLEHMVTVNPVRGVRREVWKLPDPVDLRLLEDPFADPSWREEANLSGVAGGKTSESGESSSRAHGKRRPE